MPIESTSRVTGLHIYPLKSARGVAVREIELDERGPRGDRRWMLVDADGRFISLRTVPRLALVSAAWEGEGLRLSTGEGHSIVVEAPAEVDRESWIEASVWSDTCRVLPADRSASDWISHAIGVTCRLVYLPATAEGPGAPEYGAFGSAERHIALTDGAPLLLTNEASLADLNARLAQPVSMRRFRPNVVVAAPGAFVEDRWRRVQLGEVPFDVVKGCPRCVATTVEPDTAAKGVEPLRTLATYRRRGTDVYFGMNVAHRETGVVRLGDPVRVLERSGPEAAT